MRYLIVGLLVAASAGPAFAVTGGPPRCPAGSTYTREASAPACPTGQVHTVLKPLSGTAAAGYACLGPCQPIGTAYKRVCCCGGAEYDTGEHRCLQGKLYPIRN